MHKVSRRTIINGKHNFPKEMIKLKEGLEKLRGVCHVGLEKYLPKGHHSKRRLEFHVQGFDSTRRSISFQVVGELFTQKMFVTLKEEVPEAVRELEDYLKREYGYQQ